MWQTVIFLIAFEGSPLAGNVYPPLFDTKGPYPTVEQCYMRGAGMLKQLSEAVPVIEAKVSCKQIHPPKDTPPPPAPIGGSI